MNSPKRWRELTEKQRGMVERYIATLLAQPLEIPLLQRANREVLDRKQGEGVSYQLEAVKCGKLTCKCRLKGDLHGPYWYAYWRDGRRVKCKYLGKHFRPYRPTVAEL